MIISVSYLAPGDYASLSKSESASLPARLSTFARTTRLPRRSVLAGLSSFSNCPDSTSSSKTGTASFDTNLRQPPCKHGRELAEPAAIQRGWMGKRHDRDKLVLSAGVFFAGNRQAAWEHGVEACFTSAARAKLLKVAIRLEPAERLGAQRDDVMAGPEPGEQLEDQRPETLLDRLGIGFVAGGLVRNRIGQKGVTRRVLKFAGGLDVCGSLGLPGPQHPLSHELAPGPDQRLAKSDLILAQVAPEDADRSLQRAGIENRLKRVFLEPFVDRDIDGKLLAAGTCADLLTQFFDRRGHPAGLLRSVFDPGRFLFRSGIGGLIVGPSGLRRKAHGCRRLAGDRGGHCEL